MRQINHLHIGLFIEGTLERCLRATHTFMLFIDIYARSALEISRVYVIVFSETWSYVALVELPRV